MTWKASRRVVAIRHKHEAFRLPPKRFARTMIYIMKCSRCENEAVPGQGYCHRCHAAYARDYRRTSRVRMQQRSYSEGVTATRRTLSEVFQKLGLNQLNGVTAAEVVRTTPIPESCTLHAALIAENRRLSLAGQRAAEQTKRQREYAEAAQ